MTVLEVLEVNVALCGILACGACKQKHDHWLTEPVSIYTMPGPVDDFHVVPVVKPLGKPIGSGISEQVSRTKKTEMFECTCRNEGGEIKCLFINRSSSCVLYNHQTYGPEYYLEYIDKSGVLHTEQNAWEDAVCYPHLVALSPCPADDTFIQGAMYSFSIQTPPDCKKILSLTFLISYMTFSELGDIRNIRDMGAAFMRNKVEVTAIFE